MHPIHLAENGYLPDWLIRVGIRRLLAKRLRHLVAADSQLRDQRRAELCDQLRCSPIAVETGTANQQHYEVPASFFERVLGPHLKYSCCSFPSGDESLAEAEELMLRLTCQRAELHNKREPDGMNILELGCGWGSLTLWMAQQYPHSRITAVSNSHSQRQFIMSRCERLGLENVNVITADMREFNAADRYDRIVSIEMFEHMRNYELLLERISTWLRDEGKLFIHIFTHRSHSYLFESEGANNWMGRHFFTGGIMPAQDLLGEFQRHMKLTRQWQLDGIHYWRTCQAWLERQDAQRDEILDMLCEDLPRGEAQRVFQRWRMFFMACAELFRYRGGKEWFVSHYLFERQTEAARRDLHANRHSNAVNDDLHNSHHSS